MTRLKLPDGADAGFRFVMWDAFGNNFTANIYGRGRSGWLLASRKWFGTTTATEPQSLPRGTWREFLGLVKQADFWELPESLPADPELITDDGEWLTLAGRSGERYHKIHRDGVCDRKLFQILRLLTRLSGLFPEAHPTHPLQGSHLNEPQHPVAPDHDEA